MTDTEAGDRPGGMSDPAAAEERRSGPPVGETKTASTARPSSPWADPAEIDDNGTEPHGDDFPNPLTQTRRWLAGRRRAAVADPWAAAEAMLSLVVVVGAMAVVFKSTHPNLVLRDTTPTGGDMGAHVWGPMYLLHHLLPHGRLSGWTPDWYDGFPAYQFYMVVPSLLIVAIHVGVRGLLTIPAVLATLGVAFSGWWRADLHRFRKPLLVAGLVATVLVVPVPYNVAFKLVTILGLVGLPAAAWAFGKLADLPFPIPPLLTIAAMFFIYNREPQYNGYGNIIGGNMSSTMAGEFAFSISLMFAVLYLGVAIRGLRTGRHRALAASLFALAGLCHLIPAFFVLACTAVLFVVRPGWARLRWLATMVPVAGLLTAFWVLPFVWQRNFVNDMGWEKLPVPVGDLTTAFARDAARGRIWYYITPTALTWALVLAAVGIVVSVVCRHAAGMVLGTIAILVMVAFKVLPQARLWNARLLPFLYLSVFFLAAIAVGEIVRAIATLAATQPTRPPRLAGVLTVPVAAFAALVVLGLPLDGVLPGQTRGADQKAHLVGLSTKDSNPVSSWAKWNYEGLEGKSPSATSGGYPEYHDIVATMGRLGRDRRHGCGRAFWEYSSRLDGYGTPMALMMLPYFTEGCIGSQEGLYFEASATTPYHFLMQSELSEKGSAPQRDLPYPSLDINSGVRHLQMLGVKYYMASSTSAVAAASKHPQLTQVATSGPWHVYQVVQAPVVSGLRYEPVVLDVGDGQHQWLAPSVAWFLDPARRDVPFASTGPSSWKRATFDGVPDDARKTVSFVRSQLGASGAMDRLPTVKGRALPPVQVRNTRVGDDNVSFDVDRVGVPVLVRVSYFPNWKASGADGPYRVTPNLMVVVPRQMHVTLHFGRAPVDVAAMGLTGLGLLGVVALWRLAPIAMPVPRRRREARGLRRRREPLPAGPVLDGTETVGEAVALVDEGESDGEPSVTPAGPPASYGATGPSTVRTAGSAIGDGAWAPPVPVVPEGFDADAQGADGAATAPPRDPTG